MPQIEIEHRALLAKAAYDRLATKLQAEAQDLGEDDKDVFFFVFTDKLLKVVNNVSARSAKIVLKLNKIGLSSDFEEIEIPIAQADVEKSVSAFQLLGFSDVLRSFQKRHNYVYKDVELALKYSESWGYHIELEVLVDDLSKKSQAEETIQKVADDMDLKLMTQPELLEFTAKIEAEYRAKHPNNNR